jgi:hypothetical protein
VELKGKLLPWSKEEIDHIIVGKAIWMKADNFKGILGDWSVNSHTYLQAL